MPRPAAARKLLDPLMFATWMSQVQSRLVELTQVTGFQERPPPSLLVLHLGVEQDPKFTPRTDPGPRPLPRRSASQDMLQNGPWGLHTRPRRGLDQQCSLALQAPVSDPRDWEA